MLPGAGAAGDSKANERVRDRELSIQIDDGAKVAVRREWNGWRTTMVRVRDLDNVHWFQPAHAPRPLIHADVSCATFLAGGSPQDCPLTPHPHSLRVCLLKCHTPPGVYEELARHAERVRPARVSTLANGTTLATLGATWRRSLTRFATERWRRLRSPSRSTARPTARAAAELTAQPQTPSGPTRTLDSQG
jgi:hypothetical protein